MLYWREYKSYPEKSVRKIVQVVVNFTNELYRQDFVFEEVEKKLQEAKGKII